MGPLPNRPEWFVNRDYYITILTGLDDTPSTVIPPKKTLRYKLMLLLVLPYGFFLLLGATFEVATKHLIWPNYNISPT